MAPRHTNKATANKTIITQIADSRQPSVAASEGSNASSSAKRRGRQKKVVTYAEPETQQDPPSSESTEPTENQEGWWTIDCIVAEKGSKYKVRWVGNDPKTGKPYNDDWLLKTDVSQVAIDEWESRQGFKVNKKRKKPITVIDDNDPEEQDNQQAQPLLIIKPSNPDKPDAAWFEVSAEDRIRSAIGRKQLKKHKTGRKPKQTDQPSQYQPTQPLNSPEIEATPEPERAPSSERPSPLTQLESPDLAPKRRKSLIITIIIPKKSSLNPTEYELISPSPSSSFILSAGAKINDSYDHTSSLELSTQRTQEPVANLTFGLNHLLEATPAIEELVSQVAFEPRQSPGEEFEFDNAPQKPQVESQGVVLLDIQQSLSQDFFVVAQEPEAQPQETSSEENPIVFYNPSTDPQAGSQNARVTTQEPQTEVSDSQKTSSQTQETQSVDPDPIITSSQPEHIFETPAKLRPQQTTRRRTGLGIVSLGNDPIREFLTQEEPEVLETVVEESNLIQDKDGDIVLHDVNIQEQQEFEIDDQGAQPIIINDCNNEQEVASNENYQINESHIDTDEGNDQPAITTEISEEARPAATVESNKALERFSYLKDDRLEFEFGQQSSSRSERIFNVAAHDEDLPDSVEGSLSQIPDSIEESLSQESSRHASLPSSKEGASRRSSGSIDLHNGRNEVILCESQEAQVVVEALIPFVEQSQLEKDNESPEAEAVIPLLSQAAQSIESEPAQPVGTNTSQQNTNTQVQVEVSEEISLSSLRNIIPPISTSSGSSSLGFISQSPSQPQSQRKSPQPISSLDLVAQFRLRLASQERIANMNNNKDKPRPASQSPQPTTTASAPSGRVARSEGPQSPGKVTPMDQPLSTAPAKKAFSSGGVLEAFKVKKATRDAALAAEAASRVSTPSAPMPVSTSRAIISDTPTPAPPSRDPTPVLEAFKAKLAAKEAASSRGGTPNASAPTSRVVTPMQLTPTRSRDATPQTTAPVPVLEIMPTLRSQSTPPPPIVDQPKTPDAFNSVLDALQQSQALDLVQPQTQQLSRAEHVFAVPMTAHQADLYKQLIINNYQYIERYFAAGSSQMDNSQSGISSDLIERCKKDMESLAIHPELGNDDVELPDPSNQTAVGMMMSESYKFMAIQSILENLRDEEADIVIAAKEGRLMDMLEILVRSGDYFYIRKSSSGDRSVENPQNHGNLKVTLVPTGRENRGLLVRYAKLVIALDLSFEASDQHVKQLRAPYMESDTVAPVIRLTTLSTLEHVDLCIPHDSATDRNRYLNALMFASIFLKREVGQLSPALKQQYDNLETKDLRPWLDGNIDIIAPPPVNLTNRRKEPTTPEAGLRKRGHSTSVSPPNLKIVSPKRLKVSSSSPCPTVNPQSIMQTMDVEMHDADITTPKPAESEPPTIDLMEAMDETAGPSSARPRRALRERKSVDYRLIRPEEYGLDDSSPPPSQEPPPPPPPAGDKILTTWNTAGLPEATDLATQDVDADIDMASPSPSPSLNHEEEDDEELSGEESPSMPEELIDKSSQEVIELYKKNHREHQEWIVSTAGLQQRVEDYKLEVKQLRHDLEEAHTVIARHNEMAEKNLVRHNTLKSECDILKEGLAQLRLDIVAGPDAALSRAEEARATSAEKQGKIDYLERKVTSLDQENDLFRTNYQDASRAHTFASAELDAANEENASLKAAADTNRVEIAKMNIDEERRQSSERIRQLEVMLAERDEHIRRLDVEKERGKRSRGLMGQAGRASSVPRREGSLPASRGGSPVIGSGSGHTGPGQGFFGGHIGKFTRDRL